MKKPLLLFASIGALALNVSGEYATPGKNQTFTFTKLSEIADTVVKKNGNVFEILQGFTVSETDTLVLENNAVLKLADKVEIKINGFGNFAPADTATIEGMAAAAKGLYFTGDNACGIVKNVHFETTSIRQFAPQGFLVENCTFNKCNGKAASASALTYGTSKGNVVRNCRFTEGTTSGVSSGANVQTGVIVENCYFYDNVTNNSNRPQINLTTPGNNGPTIVRNNIIIGTKRTKPGGLSVANMLGLPVGEVLIEGNEIRDSRYGMQAMGGMKVTIRNNKLIDNRYDPSPMNGGSGISLYDATEQLDATVTGNYIEGSLWGITAIGPAGKNEKVGFANINLGKTGDPKAADYNPGGNVFKDNGNDGTNYDKTKPYDLYNNSPKTIYAQGNYWSVAQQTAEEIAKVIYDKADDSKLGEVIYMPAGDAGVEGIEADGGVYFDSKNMRIYSAGMILTADIYTMQGAKAMSVAGVSEIDLANLAKGLYIAVVCTETGVSSVKFVK